MLSNMSIKTFNVKKDINIQLLKDRAFKEAASIFSKETTRKNRTLKQIREVQLYGQASEIWLLKNGFEDDEREYKDVLRNGVPIEVKTVGYLNGVEGQLKRCKEAKKQLWREYPDIIYLFIGNRKTLDYYLEGIYEWNRCSRF